MKPVLEWTQDEVIHFLTKFMGWTSGNRPAFDDVKSFMEKKWPEMWEEYLSLYMPPYSPRTYTDCLYEILNLNNLVNYLLEPEQIEVWGWVECPDCEKHTVMKWPIYCSHCNKGQKHPALIYAEGLK